MGDAFGEGATVGDDVVFVPDPTRPAREITKRRRHQVAEVVGAEPFRQPQLPQGRRSAIEVSRLLAVVIRADADARRRADERHLPPCLGLAMV